MTADLVTRLRNYGNAMPGTLGDAKPFSLALEAAAEIERLRETLICPRLMPDAPTGQFAAVLNDWEKERPVNTQDLVNALAWRMGNQRREIARLRQELKKSDDEKRDVNVKASWKERQGDEYGSY